jgi:hypothetical protein
VKKIQVRKVGTVRLTGKVAPLYSILCGIHNG